MNWTNKIIVCKKKAYAIEDFIDICISSWTRTKAAEQFGCSEKTLGIVLKEQIPELETSTAPLGKRFLSLLELKKCSACGEVKSFDEFHRDKYKNDGTTSQCAECRHASDKVFRTENPEKIAAYAAKRRSAKLKRTPKWADIKKIEEIYITCPEGHEVDHIIPLQGKNVSGLHVEGNLQYLTKEKNRAKSNKYGDE